MYRAWASNAINDDRIDIYLARYEADDNSEERWYGMFDPIEGIVWHSFKQGEIIRPFLSLSGLDAAICFQEADDVLIHRLLAMGRRVHEVLNQPTYQES